MRDDINLSPRFLWYGSIRDQFVNGSMPCASGSLYGGATQECNSCLCGPTSSVCVKSLRGKNVRIGGKRYTYLGHEFSVAGGLPTTTWEHWQAKLSGKSMDGHQRRKRLTETYYASIVHRCVWSVMYSTPVCVPRLPCTTHSILEKHNGP